MLAWVIEGLSRKNGFVTASNSTLARETGIALNKIDATLQAMEALGVIIRGKVPKGGGSFERRIWPILGPFNQPPPRG